MKNRMLLRTIYQHALIYECLVVVFAISWFMHHLALWKMEGCNRHFAVMDGRTLRAMALIDWGAVNSWLAVAYVCLTLASVAFLQVRGHPRWTWWATAIVFCVPCVVYWFPCAYIAGKLLAF